MVGCVDVAYMSNSYNARFHTSFVFLRGGKAFYAGLWSYTLVAMSTKPIRDDSYL
jgi:hypothetical protein